MKVGTAVAVLDTVDFDLAPLPLGFLSSFGTGLRLRARGVPFSAFSVGPDEPSPALQSTCLPDPTAGEL